MFSFFGLLADPVADLPKRISAAWPELNPMTIDKPITAVGVRFGARHYQPSLKDTPPTLIRTVEELSRQSPERFMLLRTECGGGDCANWGQFIREGETVFQAEGDGALRRLIKHWGVDLGPSEIFHPLGRDFPWE
jgi:hypothetical protein